MINLFKIIIKENINHKDIFRQMDYLIEKIKKIKNYLYPSYKKIK